MSTSVSIFPLRGTLFFDVTTHNVSTGAVVDADQAPQFDVFEDDSDTVLYGTISMTKRTNKTGNYRGRAYIDPTVGFEIGRQYHVIVAGTVNSIAGKQVARHFMVVPSQNALGIPQVDIAYVAGTPLQDGAAQFGANVVSLAGNAVKQSGGYVGIDWNQINNPTAGVQLPNTQMGTVVSLGHPARAQVNTEADTALVDINLDQLVKIAVTSSFAASVHVSSILGQMADAGSGTFNRTTDSLEAIRDRGDAAWTGTGPTYDTFGTLGLIRAATANLPPDPADASDIAASFASVQASINPLYGTVGAVKGSVDLISARIPTNLTNDGNIKADVQAIRGSINSASNIREAWSGQGGVTLTATFAGRLTGMVGSLDTVAKAQVNTEADTALSDINLDQLAKNAVPSSFAASVHVSSILGQVADKGSGTFDRTTDSLEAIRDRGDAAWTGTGPTYDTFGTLALIRASTANLPPDPADASDIAASFSAETAARNIMYGTLQAIKVKTDILPASFPTNFPSLGINALGDINKVVVAGTIVTYVGNTPQTGDAFARIGAPVGASISADIAAVQADLPQQITKNTALANFPFKMVLSSDHVSAATGLTITATRSIDGAAFSACANSASEVGGGIYKINLAASDLNGTTIVLRFTGTNADTREVVLFPQPT